jgi:UDP-2,3-diacylglucosamine pyrophosphatase LpxH
VGDIIDGWRLRKKFYWPQSHTNVVRRILTAAKRGTRVIYIAGNHDEALRGLMPFGVNFGNIELLNSYKYTAVNGKTYMVMHGDAFDTLIRVKLKFLYHVGDVLYNWLLEVNHWLQKLRNFFGMNYWSLSAYLKYKTKQALSYLSDYELLLVDYCKRKQVDGVICGHVHHADIKIIDGIEYMNDGDWVESMSALVEHHDGTWEIIYWSQERDKRIEKENLND